jgi:carbonic anhydrase
VFLIIAHSQFHATDTNAAACLAYVVAALKTIDEIWVVGHTDCGGVKACYNAVHSPPPKQLDSSIWKWLGSLLTLALLKRNLTLRQLTDENVRVQVANVKTTLVVLKPERPIKVKGYVYVLGKKAGEGILEEIK